MAAEAKIVDRSYAVADPLYPERCIRPNADGSINVNTSSAPANYTSAGVGEYNLAVDNVTPKALTPPADAIAAQITVTGDNVRYRDDGIVPSATVGMPVFQGTSWFYIGPLSAIKFIAQTATGAVIDVSYYK